MSSTRKLMEDLGKILNEEKLSAPGNQEDGSSEISEGLAGSEIVKRMARMTDRNDHNGALVLAAEAVGAKKIEKIMKHVAEIHKIEGSMPSYLSKYVYDLMKDLQSFAKKKLSKEDYEAWNNGL